MLITFDDGYRDTLENALPVLQKHGYRAVIFVPVAYMEDETPLPHETQLVERGVRNPTLDWGLVRELDAGGVRVESHGIAHRPLAEVSLDEAVREIAVSKLELEEQLGRPVRAYAYVKGSKAHFQPVHVSLAQAGRLRGRVHVRLGLERRRRPTRCGSAATTSSRTRRARSSSCSRGACDLIALKDTVAGTRARRLFNQALGTVHAVTEVTAVGYEPSRRAELVELMAQRLGRPARPASTSSWWFDESPVAPGVILLAEDDGERRRRRSA